MNEEKAALPPELDAADLLDPNPDILGLFCHYNDIYFDSKLHACTVDWSTSRMTLCAGICKYDKGSCAIRLSVPLLKFRSSAELKETLLHEMIHAYLWLTDSNKDHNDHGPCFQKMMQAINDSQAADHQRPKEGYHITIYHNFSEEVNSYRQHHWKCIRCGDVIKRANNRAPSQADCFQKAVRGNVCSNEHCHWHGHQQHCGGEYEKIAEPEGYKDRRTKSRRSGKEIAAERELPSKVNESKHMSKKESAAADKVTDEKIKDKEDNTSSRMHKNTSLEMYFSCKNICKKEEPVIAVKLEDVAEVCKDDSSEEEMARKKDRKRRREYKGGEIDNEDFYPMVEGWHTPILSKRQDARVTVQKNECTVIIGWKGWFAFEGEEDEKNMKALDNKRSQRRMFERACCQVQNTGNSADSLRVSVNQGIVSHNREMVECREIKELRDNLVSPFAVCLRDQFVTTLGGVSGNTPRQSLLHDEYSRSSIPLDPPAEGLAVTCDSAMLGHNERAGNTSFAHTVKMESLGEPTNPTIACEDSSIVVQTCQETLAFASAEGMSLIESVDYATEGPANMEEGLPAIVNKCDYETRDLEARSGGDLQIDDAARIGEFDGVGEAKIMRKGRSKRVKKDKGASNDSSQRGGPSAACPICHTILPGDIEDANFNTKFNQHIDACMSSLET
eukprot:c13827_g1_i1 orf=134-2152(+)